MFYIIVEKNLYSTYWLHPDFEVQYCYNFIEIKFCFAEVNHQYE